MDCSYIKLLPIHFSSSLLKGHRTQYVTTTGVLINDFDYIYILYTQQAGRKCVSKLCCDAYIYQLSFFHVWYYVHYNLNVIIFEQML